MLSKRYAVLGLATVTGLLAAVLTLCMMTPIARAMSCNVPTVDYPTIQSAVDDLTCSEINVAAGIFAENVSINRKVNILGQGTISTTVDGSGNNSVFTVGVSGVAVVEDLQITNGRYDRGGGIHNMGNLTLKNSIVSGNTAWGDGGGVFNGGTMTVHSSTISFNSAPDWSGGGVRNEGTMDLYNTTVSNNLAGLGGGGISDEGGTLRLFNCTVSENYGGWMGMGGIAGSEYGSDITLRNTILANNTARDCGFTIMSDGYNLVGDTTDCNFVALESDLLNVSPLIGQLDDYGGSTPTHSLLSGSPAIDAGDNTNCPVVDQRGVPRPLDGDGDGVPGCDIGAVEFIPSGFLFSSTTTVNTDKPDPSYVNQPFTVTFSVSSTFGLPTGAVSVTVSDSSASCKGILTEGSGSCIITIADQGTYSLTAIYTGNDTHLPSSDTELHTVNKADTTTAIIGNIPDPPLVNQPFTVTFSVSSTFGVPTGAVSVTVSDSSASCNGTLNAGLGSCQITITDQGTYTLTATYIGSAAHNPSSDTALYTLNKADTTTTITGNTPNPSLVNQPFTVTFSVSSTFGLPTGVISVTASDSEEDCSGALTDGFGNCNLTLSTSGTYTLTAAYLGNDTHSPSSDSDMHHVIPPKLFLPLVIEDDQP